MAMNRHVQTSPGGSLGRTLPAAGEDRLWPGARRFARNRLALVSLLFLLALAAATLFAPLVAPAHYATDDLLAAYERPGEGFVLGADFMGRDILSRLIYGARVSLSVAMMGALLSFAIGVAYGVTAGHVGGRWDALMMRAVDVLYALPTLVVIILIMVYFRAGQPEQFTGLKALLYAWDDALGGMLFIFVGIGLTSWLQMARVARGETLAIKGRDYVQSALALGISNQRLMLRHMLPNLLGPCIVLESATIPAYILTEAFLSFIGLGVNPPMPSWGAMINEGYQAMRAYPHVILWPVLALTATVLAFNFLGDGLRDALDPRLAD
ncbi:MAG: ABC transporter permease [SAR324 cluster bacterium]|nr:ABC transporter permease [SAR324 cluster bacterium]